MKELVSVLMDIYEEIKRLRTVEELKLRAKVGAVTLQEIADELGVDLSKYF